MIYDLRSRMPISCIPLPYWCCVVGKLSLFGVLRRKVGLSSFDLGVMLFLRVVAVLGRCLGLTWFSCSEVVVVWWFEGKMLPSIGGGDSVNNNVTIL